MEDHEAKRHPGPWRVMRVDSEFAGLLVAVGFLVLGLVSMPIGTWFVVGCLVLGAVFALLLRFTPKRFIRLILGMVIIPLALVLWWVGGPPLRPHNVSSNAIHLDPNKVGFTVRQTGYWLDCWFDKDSNVDRCRLTDAKGAVLFEDAFLPCVGQNRYDQSDLVFDAMRTGYTWTRSRDNGIKIPVVYLKFGSVLLPRSLYAEAKQDSGCSAY